MELTHFFNAIWYRRWLLIFVPTTLAILVFFLTANLEKDYRSTARLSAGFTQKNQVSVEEEKIGRYEVEVKFTNLIEKMYSSHVMDLLTYSLIIHDLDNLVPFREIEFNHDEKPLSEDARLRMIAYGKHRLDPKNMVESVYETYRDDSLFKSIIEKYKYHQKDLIENNIYIRRVAFSDYINVVATTENPKLSTFIVNEYCRLFIEYNNQLKSRNSDEHIESLRKILESKEKEVFTLNQAYLDSLSKNKSKRNTPIESEASSQQLMKLEGEYNKLWLANRRMSKQIEHINEKLLNKDRKTASLSPRELSVEYNNKYEYFRKEYERSNFQNKAYEDSAQHYMQLMASIQTKQSNLNAILSPVEYRELVNKRENLKLDLDNNIVSYQQQGREISRLKNLIKDNEVEGGAFSELEGKLKSARADYEQTDKRHRLELNKSQSGSSIRLDLPGYPPDQAEPSKRILFIFGSFFGGIVMLMGLIIVFELLDFSLKSSNIFQSRTGLNLLGSFIFINNSKKLENSLFGNKAETKINHLGKFTELVRKTRFNLEKNGKKVILFTSCKPKAGKSFIIRALADVFVLKGKKVLIVDLNFKNNTLTELYKVEKRLSADTGNIDKVGDYIQNTSLPGVDVMGIEPTENSLTEVLNERFLNDSFEYMRERYDFILVEAANLNEFSDSMDIERYVDTVISVFSAQESIKFIDEQSISYLESLNDKFLGSILNRVEYRYVND